MTKDARAWANYESGYRPMVELSKAAGLPVVAANAPRRYVSAVGRDGEAAMAQGPWGARARADLPPQPLPEPSAAYVARLMADPEVVPRVAEPKSSPPKSGGCPYTGLRSEQGLVAPMKLWDASMAYSIAQALGAHASSVVVHVCGSDHIFGILECLNTYRPSAKPVVIFMSPEDDFATFVAARHGDRGDFVVLTDASASATPPQ